MANPIETARFREFLKQEDWALFPYSGRAVLVASGAPLPPVDVVRQGPEGGLALSLVGGRLVWVQSWTGGYSNLQKLFAWVETDLPVFLGSLVP